MSAKYVQISAVILSFLSFEAANILDRLIPMHTWSVWTNLSLMLALFVAQVVSLIVYGVGLYRAHIEGSFKAENGICGTLTLLGTLPWLGHPHSMLPYEFLTYGGITLFASWALALLTLLRPRVSQTV